MKTIAYVLTAFPVLSETFIGNEMRAMQAHGHRIVPFVFDLRDGPAQPRDDEIAAHAVPVARIPAWQGLRMLPLAWRALTFLWRQQRLSRRSLLWNGLKLAGAIRAAGCSHVHAHFAGGGAAHGVVAARIAGRPVSFTCHGHDVYAEPEDLEVKLAAADRVVAVCADLESDLRAMNSRAALVRIPCGTDPERFQPRDEDAGDNGRFLFIGRFVGSKGLDDLFEALGFLEGKHRIRLDIVGDGPLRAQIGDAAERINRQAFHHIRLLGSRDAAWLASHGPAYRAVCLPFKATADGNRETGPLVVKEAMAMGLPVISTAFMGVKEMVTPQTGILVPPADPVALAQAIGRMDAMPAERRRAMGAAGRLRLLRHFTLGAQAGALSAMVEAA
ncbi:MAG: glycosyltransferase [Zhengella sp.]|uniref:glycosyltransferase n=1 Tax=Zhengella sp. TaxID=2282762 RepID=UPI001D5D88C0|nr:glycosyltransferase [Notoacmeibacter sp.]